MTFLGCLSGLALAAVPGMCLGSSPASTAAMASARRVQVSANYGKLPLHFIANQGQVDSQVRFYARRGGSTFFFTRKGLVLTLPEAGSARSRPDRHQVVPRSLEPAKRRRVAVRFTPVGLASGVKLEAVEPLPGRVNYFIGNDPKKWRTDIPTYRAVVYREAYPGIDLKFYGNGRQLEYDIVARPGADPSIVKFLCQGLKSLEITPAGDLALTQMIFGGYSDAFVTKLNSTGNSLIYSTYLGGNDGEEGCAIAVDGAGCAYVTGITNSSGSTGFPTLNAYQADNRGADDAFVTKLNARGNAICSTYLGGGDNDYGRSIAVDEVGCAYVAGWTTSGGIIGFPTLNACQANYGGANDAFVTKLYLAPPHLPLELLLQK